MNITHPGPENYCVEDMTDVKNGTKIESKSQKTKKSGKASVTSGRQKSELDTEGNTQLLQQKFPNFFALTDEERFVFRDTLLAARKNIEERQNIKLEQLGTIHDQFLNLPLTEKWRSKQRRKQDSGQPKIEHPVDPPVLQTVKAPPLKKRPGSSRTVRKNPSLESKNRRKVVNEEEYNQGEHLSGRSDKASDGRRPTVRVNGPTGDEVDKAYSKTIEGKKRDLDQKYNEPKRKVKRSETKNEKSPGAFNAPKFGELSADEKKIFFQTLKAAYANIVERDPRKRAEIIAFSDLVKMYSFTKGTEYFTAEGNTRDIRVKLGMTIGSKDNERIRKVKSGTEAGDELGDRISSFSKEKQEVKSFDGESEIYGSLMGMGEEESRTLTRETGSRLLTSEAQLGKESVEDVMDDLESEKYTSRESVFIPTEGAESKSAESLENLDADSDEPSQTEAENESSGRSSSKSESEQEIVVPPEEPENWDFDKREGEDYTFYDVENSDSEKSSSSASSSSESSSEEEEEEEAVTENKEETEPEKKDLNEEELVKRVFEEGEEEEDEDSEGSEDDEYEYNQHETVEKEKSEVICKGTGKVWKNGECVEEEQVEEVTEDDVTEDEVTEEEGKATEGEVTEEEGKATEGEVTEEEGKATEGEVTEEEGKVTEGEVTEEEGKATEGEVTEEEGKATEVEVTEEEEKATEGEITEEEDKATEGEVTEDEVTEGEVTEEEGKVTEDEVTEDEGKVAEGEVTEEEDKATEGEVTEEEDKATEGEVTEEEDKVTEDEVTEDEGKVTEGEVTEDEVTEGEVTEEEGKVTEDEVTEDEGKVTEDEVTEDEGKVTEDEVTEDEGKVTEGEVTEEEEKTTETETQVETADEKGKETDTETESILKEDYNLETEEETGEDTEKGLLMETDLEEKDSDLEEKYHEEDRAEMDKESFHTEGLTTSEEPSDEEKKKGIESIASQLSLIRKQKSSSRKVFDSPIIPSEDLKNEVEKGQRASEGYETDDATFAAESKTTSLKTDLFVKASSIQNIIPKKTKRASSIQLLRRSLESQTTVPSESQHSDGQDDLPRRVSLPKETSFERIVSAQDKDSSSLVFNDSEKTGEKEAPPDETSKGTKTDSAGSLDHRIENEVYEENQPKSAESVKTTQVKPIKHHDEELKEDPLDYSRHIASKDDDDDDDGKDQDNVREELESRYKYVIESMREIKPPKTKIRVLQDLLKDRAVFVKTSTDTFVIKYHVADDFKEDIADESTLVSDVEPYEEELGKQKKKYHWQTILEKIFTCGRKEAEEIDAVVENLKGESVPVEIEEKAKNPANATLDSSTMKVLQAAKRKKILEQYGKL